MTKSREFSLILALLLISVSTVFSQDDLVAFEIKGVIVTDENVAVPNAALELTYTSLVVNEEGIATSKDGRLAVNSDENGNYSLQVNLDPDWNDFTLRIASTNLDSFRYRDPNERLLTDAIRNAVSGGTFTLEVNWIISSRPTWQEELIEIERYGQDSDKGRLIRVRGLPERIQRFTRRNESGEIWFYYTSGIAVRFIGDKREKDFYFKPK